jgi:molybdopterin converting factor subunit 1
VTWSMTRVKVLFFATLRERAGMKALDLEIPDGMDVKGLKRRLSIELPNLGQAMESVLISVNHEYAFEEEVIPSNSEVALFPPVSGG